MQIDILYLVVEWWRCCLFKVYKSFGGIRGSMKLFINLRLKRFWIENLNKFYFFDFTLLNFPDWTGDH